MMAAETSYTRLGLFLVVGLVVMIATAAFFIERMMRRAVIPVVTYFTENVSGLDISSPVRYRGVSVGQVAAIRIDPRGSIVEVDFELFQDRLASIGANMEHVQEVVNLGVFPKMRARVVGNPITGEGYLLLDQPPDAPPPMNLGFTPTRMYVASMPSPMTVLQDRLPAVLQDAEMTLTTLREIVAKVPDSLDRSDRFFTNVERIMRDSHLPELSADSRTFFATTSGQIAQLTSSMDRLVGTEGTLTKFAEEARGTLRDANLPASSQAARDAAERTSMAADDLRRSLPAIRESLEQLRELARRLEEQPESVVYGPRKGKGKS